jgi:hypothetical protein
MAVPCGAFVLSTTLHHFRYLGLLRMVNSHQSKSKFKKKERRKKERNKKDFFPGIYIDISSITRPDRGIN